MKIIRAVSLTLFIYGLLGWFYIVLSTIFHPSTLTIQLTHLTPWIREDTFGILCFVISFIGFFVWNLTKDKR